MKWLTATLCLVAILACTGNAMAARCAGISPVVFCDDFDRYCLDPPLDPALECDGDIPDPEDILALWAYWPQSDGTCSYNLPYSLWTKPDVHFDYAAVMAAQDPDTLRLARHVHDMTTEIENNPLNTESYGGINGSGEILASTDPSYVDPDTISTVLKGHTYIHNGKLDGGGTLRCGAYANFTYYTELNLDGDRAPTNFVWRNCFKEVHDHGGGPHQLLQATDVNPDPGTTWHHASFAFGLVAHFDDFVDANPCNVDAGRKPTAWRAFVYDGKDWTRLKAPEFDLPVPDDADFRPWMEWNLLRFFVGTDDIEVRLYNARAEAIYSSGSTCGLQSCNTKRCFGGLDHWGLCTSAADCRPSQGSCVSGFCDGGTNDGNACTLPEHCPDAPPTIAQPYFVARVPRAYKGPFNTIALGAGKGVSLGVEKPNNQTVPTKCEEISGAPPHPTKCVGGINHGDDCSTVADCPPSVGTCASGFCDGGTNHGGGCSTDAQCPDFQECLQPVSKWNMNMAVDDVILWDGDFVPTPGACCRTDTAICEDEVLETNCTGDDIWHGGQICDDILCCPKPWADIDFDDDVDQLDFAAFQLCLGHTAPTWPAACECFNKDNTGGSTDIIDGMDFAEFKACATGPDAPMNLGSPPAGCTP